MTRLRTRSEERAALLAASLEDPEVAPFLPALYAAWVDGDLTDEELETLRAHVHAAEGLRPRTREALELWLDPEEPPATGELHLLRERIHERIRGLPEVERLSLVDLGLGLPASPEEAPGAEDRALLGDLVRAVGETGLGAVRRLLRPDLLLRDDGEASEQPELPPAFDVATMTALLEPDHHETRAEVRALLPGLRADPGIATDAYRDLALDWCRTLADRGLGALAFPEEHGGGGSLGGSIAVFEVLAFGDLSLLVKFGVQFGLFGGALLRLGTPEQHARWLPAAGTLELPGCFAMTETGHGSDVQALRTTATYDDASREFVVHTPDDDARKDYIGNAARHGRAAVVFAQLRVGDDEHGVHALVVPIRDEAGAPLPGVRIEDCGQKLGLNGVDNGRLWFDQVRVPREALLARFARVSEDGTYSSPIASQSKRFFTMIGTLVHGRVSVAAGALSAAKTALAIAVRYGQRRRQFGETSGRRGVRLLDYPTHQRRLLVPLAETYALHFAVRHLVALDVALTAAGHTTDRQSRELEGLAAGVKAAATWHATATIQACREACGGAGYLAENRFAALKADTDVFTTFEGDNTVLLQLVAKGLLTGYRQQFEDMNLISLARLVGERAIGILAESSPFAGRSVGEGDLRDRELQLGLFRRREEHTLATLARRLKAMTDEGSEPPAAFLACQDHVLLAARAHVDRLVLEYFVAGIERCDDRDVTGVLDAVCDLYALSRMEAERGWFLEHGQFAASASKAIPSQVDAACAALWPHAVALVDAFGIPDEVLAAPIALGGPP